MFCFWDNKIRARHSLRMLPAAAASHYGLEAYVLLPFSQCILNDFSGMNHSSVSLCKSLPSSTGWVLLQRNHLSLVVILFISPIHLEKCYCALVLIENAKNLQGEEHSSAMNYRGLK